MCQIKGTVAQEIFGYNFFGPGFMAETFLIFLYFQRFLEKYVLSLLGDTTK
jgi:hypothetical protein